MQGRQQSFTLIEMLIVIMIITILMALLSPALMQAKSTAKRVTCASNIKQFAVCYFLYRADSVDQWLPRSGLDNSDRMGYDLQHFEDGIASAMEGYGVSVELSTCPANPTIPRGWETVAGEQIFFLDHYSSYSYLDGEFHPVYGKEMDVGDSATHVTLDSAAALFGDSNLLLVIWSTLYSNHDGNPATGGTPPAIGWNTGFADGRVSWIKGNGFNYSGFDASFHTMFTAQQRGHYFLDP